MKQAAIWEVPEFEEFKDDLGYLLGTAEVCGQPFHVCAVAVVYDVDSCAQRAAHEDGANPSRLEALDHVTGAYKPLATIVLPGRSGEWVLWVEPYEC